EEMHQDAFRNRRHFAADVVPGARPHERDVVNDGATQYEFTSTIGQLSVYQQGGGWAWDRPSKLFPNVVGLQKIVATDTDSHQATVQTSVGQADFDTRDGTIVRVQRDNGRVAQFHRFADYVPHQAPEAGTLLVPTFSASATIVDGRASLVTLFVIEEVQFPVRVDDSKFALPVPKGTTAVLFPPGKKSDALVVTSLKENLVDARRYLDILRDKATRKAAPPQLAQTPPEPPERAVRFWWLYVVNGLALAAIAVALIARRRGERTAAKHD
ncbi:MAG: hypothetical protein ACF8TS_14755, partial [Maioricimonas sp. JB049]